MELVTAFTARCSFRRYISLLVILVILIAMLMILVLKIIAAVPAHSHEAKFGTSLSAQISC